MDNMANQIKHATVRWVQGKEFEATTESERRVIMDAPVASGGQNSGPSPMELLLVSLGGCTGMDVVAILRKKQQAVSGVEIRIEAVRAETYPMIYTDITVVYAVRGKDISPKAVEDAIHLSETKYCGVGAMLAKAANLKTRYEIISE
jgi:putative redox protein